MSDHDHDHEHERGGHEIDKLPNARLFNLLFGLSALVLVSSIGVVQLFNMQVAGIEKARAKQISFRLQEYRDEMNRVQSSWGQATVLEENGQQTVLHHMPLAEARQRVLQKPELLGAAPKYRGWDSSGAGKAIAAEQEKFKAAMPPAVPSRRIPTEPEGEQPAGDAPAGEQPAEEKPAEQPAGDAPAGEQPAEEKPAGDEPAGDHGHDHDHDHDHD